LAWMVKNQKSDGSYEGSVYAQPAITALGVMLVNRQPKK